MLTSSCCGKQNLDSSLPEGQFLIHGYGTVYMIDQYCHERGSIMFIVEDDLLSKLLLLENSCIESFQIELNLRK